MNKPYKVSANASPLTSTVLFKLGVIAIWVIVGILPGCKKDNSQARPEQIMGKKFATYNQWLYSKPNTNKKEDQVTLVYMFEEVTGLSREEIEVNEGNAKKTVEFWKIRTVDNKEGYAPASGFVEGILFVVQDGLNAFLKPTFTAGTKGRLTRGSFCFIKERIAEFTNVDCREAVLPDDRIKLEDHFNVWINVVPESVSQDPLLGESVKNLRQVSLDMIKLRSATEPDAEKLRKSIGETLEKILEKEDIFSNEAKALQQRLQFL